MAQKKVIKPVSFNLNDEKDKALYDKASKLKNFSGVMKNYIKRLDLTKIDTKDDEHI